MIDIRYKYVGDHSLSQHQMKYMSDMWNYENKDVCWWWRKVVGRVRKFLSSDNRA